MNNDILFITAYKDINREKWKNYQRTNEEYFKCFYKLTEHIEYTLIVFIEDKIKDILLSKYNFKSNIIFKNIESVNTFYNKFLETDTIIINSDNYKKKIPLGRKQNPEHIYSEYNLINHSKINKKFIIDFRRRKHIKYMHHLLLI